MVNIFDDTATGFAASTDAQIERGIYRRGQLFMSSARKWISPGGYILDYGCGPGRISRLIAQSGYSVLGVDPSVQMIERAKEQLLVRENLRFALLSNDWLKRATYDGIVCSSVIEY